MIYPSPKFLYHNLNQPIAYNGLRFESILELKYALMIKETHAYLREAVRIYFDPGMCHSTNYIKENTRVYVPDFLSRNIKTGKAILAEIKPTCFDHFGWIAHRTKIANHYIHTNGYDWEFKIVWAKDILLSDRAQEKLDRLLFDNKERLQQFIIEYLNRKYPLDVPKHRYDKLSESEYRLFIKRNFKN